MARVRSSVKRSSAVDMRSETTSVKRLTELWNPNIADAVVAFDNLAFSAREVVPRPDNVFAFLTGTDGLSGCSDLLCAGTEVTQAIIEGGGSECIISE